MLKQKFTKQLAIVIPAYKLRYFQETLQSLADQTCKNFTVYIGIDGSPDDLEEIIKDFQPDIDIVCKRFDTNLGGGDLVAHWERCIDMVDQEEWIWLFSDDDRIDTNCVEQFYEYLLTFENVDLVHFDVQKIDGEGNYIDVGRFPNFPRHYAIEDYCHDRMVYAQQSYVVEFVFRKSKFFNVGRYEKFDLGWGTDVATCIKLGHPGGIETVPDARVYWRQSDFNISPNNSREMVARKLDSVVEFMIWIKKFELDNGVSFSLNPFRIYLKRWFAFRGRIGLGCFCHHLKRLYAI